MMSGPPAGGPPFMRPGGNRGGPGRGPGGPGHGQDRANNPKELYEPPKKKKMGEITKDDYIYLKSLVRKYRKNFLSAIVMTVISSIITILPPLLIQILIDDYIINKKIQGIFIMGLILIGVYASRWVATYWQNKIMTKTGLTMVSEMRQRVFSKIIALPMQYHNEQKRGELLSVIVNDVERISDAINSGIITIFSDIISFIGVLYIMLSMNVRLTLISLIIIPILIIPMLTIRTKLRKESYNIQENTAKLSANVEESISGIREIQSFAVEDRNKSKFTNIAQENVRANLRSNKLTSVFGAIVSINTYIGTAVIIGFGGNMVIEGLVSIGILFAFLQYISKLIQPVTNFSQIYNTLQIGAASLIHINTYLQMETVLQESEDPISLSENGLRSIELKDVVFDYGRKPLFQGINLKINPGEKIGLVGETGAGKSTLIKLITRMYDVKEGSVLIDGIDIRNISNKELRKNTAIVSQKVTLFSDSILENIKFSNPDASREEVIEAAKNANADDFIQRTPLGYDTQVGEEGTRLSGGQRQLLSYSRLLLVRPKIVILDEATSFIDSYTETKIQQNMQHLLKNCTTIIIAHRFATLKEVDRIIVLKDGEIQDIGSHREIFQRNPYYQELCKKQFYN